MVNTNRPFVVSGSVSVPEVTVSPVPTMPIASPPSVKVGNGRRFHRSDLDAWIRVGGILAFKKAEGADANFKINSSS